MQSGPTATIAAMAEQLGAMAVSTGHYLVPCGAYLPDLTFTIGGKVGQESESLSSPI